MQTATTIVKIVAKIEMMPMMFRRFIVGHVTLSRNTLRVGAASSMHKM